MISLFNKVKRFFTKEKSPEALKMWEDLSYDGDPEFHPNLNIDINLYINLKTQAAKDRYLYELMLRRQEAHEKHR